MTDYDYEVAIPSRARAETIERCTLPTVLKRGVPAERVTVWVTEGEVADYAPLEARWGVRVRDHGAPPGVRNARNAMVRQYPVGTRLVQMDDDLRDVRFRIDSKTLAPVTDVDGLIRAAFAMTDREAVNMWGIYPVENPYFMKERTFLGLCYIIASFYGFTVTGDDQELVVTDDKEDYERSVRYFIRDGAVARMENVTVKSNYYTEPGGLQTYRTPETIAHGARTLVSMYPDLCTYTVNKSRGTAEVRLKRLRGASVPPVVAR